MAAQKTISVDSMNPPGHIRVALMENIPLRKYIPFMDDPDSIPNVSIKIRTFIFDGVDFDGTVLYIEEITK